MVFVEDLNYLGCSIKWAFVGVEVFNEDLSEVLRVSERENQTPDIIPSKVTFAK